MDSYSGNEIMVDLHVHTTCSDGTDKPEEVVKLASLKGLSLISITDHDTVSGLESAVNAGKVYGVEVIPGIEVTADTSMLPASAEFHVLGYFINPDSPSILELVDFFSKSREERNRILIERLGEEGFNITYDELEKLFGKNFGKPNIVTMLVKKQMVSSRKKAFALLRRLKVKRRKLDYREIFRLIKEAGGIPVLAHPCTLKLGCSGLYEFVSQLKREGLEGIEVIHSEHTPSMVVNFKEMAKELGLYTTGGSDYHGYNKPDIDIGMLKIKMKDLNFGVFAGV
ncbi:PHP domain-containing protein [Desulfurobacterium sp.]|uniref:PHP domain-containing protein n=1 Tax=Desulfurobacterium sp. TaxID=2004706 RepID=UPI002638ADDC|nr:PHP domain-containing protein [Desulfurobacterium sp.]